MTINLKITDTNLLYIFVLLLPVQPLLHEANNSPAEADPGSAVEQQPSHIGVQQHAGPRSPNNMRGQRSEGISILRATQGKYW